MPCRTHASPFFKIMVRINSPGCSFAMRRDTAESDHAAGGRCIVCDPCVAYAGRDSGRVAVCLPDKQQVHASCQRNRPCRSSPLECCAADMILVFHRHR